MMWLQGAYVYDAILSASPVLHDFAKKGTKAIPYMEYPIPLSYKEAKEQKAEKERRAYAELKAYADSLRKRKETETGGDEVG